MSPDTSINAAILRGMALMQEDRSDEAIKYFENLADENPAEARVHLYLAFSYDGDGREADAIPHYEQAIALGLKGDELRDAYIGLGSSYRELDDPTASRDVLREGISYCPGDTVLPVFLALALYDMGNAAAALQLMGDVALRGGVPAEWQPAIRQKLDHLK